jgi:hypothetical protein
MTTYSGSSHCGGIAFEFESDPITEGLECNCSICRRRGSIWHFMPASAFTLKTPRENLAAYRFYKKAITHHFCPTCGVAPFSEGEHPPGSPVVALNLRCVEGLDLSAVKRNFVDGAAV